METVSPGIFNVILDGQLWLESGDVAFRQGGQLHSQKKGSLKWSGSSKKRGTDGLGPYELEQDHWSAAGMVFTTGVRRYVGVPAVIFEQEFPEGAEDVQVPDGWRCGSDMEPWGDEVDQWLSCDFIGVASSFPAFRMDASSSRSELGFMQFVGAHLNDAHNDTHRDRGPWLGRWAQEQPASGLSAGPLSIFDSTGMGVVIGPAESAMASSIAVADGELQFGLVGSARRIPQGFRHSVLLHAGEALNPTWRQWGASLLAMHNTSRGEDFTATHLGYQTDNGAYYYYEPDPSIALRAIHSDGLSRNIPYRFAHLDSWWYWKSNQSMGGGGVPLGGGVLNWTAMPSVFPGGNAGMQELHEETGWPFMAHNRWWSNQTQYAAKWKFAVESHSEAYPDIGMAMPLDHGFWDSLFKEAKGWGLHTYEQDWLWTNYLGMSAALEDVTVGREWLLDMGKSALDNDLSVMYCMALPRMLLQSAEIPAVTQIRVSDDYGLAFSTGNVPQQWRIGRSSLLADALRLKPFKDGFFSDGNAQVGGHASGKTEPFPELQAAVATLSAGAVMPNDGAGHGDAALIRRSCMADGRLLQPARPAVALGNLLISEAFAGKTSGDGLSRSEVWVTSSIRGHAHMLVADLQHSYEMPLVELVAEALIDSGRHLAYESSKGRLGELRELQPDGAMQFRARALPEFEVWHFSPIIDDRWALLGELAKWVPTAARRFEFGDSEVTHTPQHSVIMHGAVGETVELSVAERSNVNGEASWSVRHAACIVPSSQRIIVKLPELECGSGPTLLVHV